MTTLTTPTKVKWIFPDEQVDQTELDRLVKATGASRLTVEILYRRGFCTSEEIKRFLAPDQSQLHDPRLLPGVSQAIERVLAAQRSGEPVVVYGDYDCDGITSTYTMLQVLRALGIAADYYIPNRLDEGYGLNAEAVTKLAEKYSLMITVDSGITACREVELANSLGLDVIITDHHTPGEELPPALAVINPKIAESKYPFPELAGVGVAYKVAQALWEAAQPDLPVPLSPAVVMLGTVADIVPLVDENRIIVAQGLANLPATDNLGLKALIQEAGKNPAEVTAGQVAFNLAPRINAAGRLGQADLALQLLLCTDQTEAFRIARKLSQLNAKRQSIEEEILAEAVKAVEETWQPEDKAIVVAGEGWHSGVVGIVAARLVELYSRPSVVITLEGDEGHGSARSVPGVNIYDALSRCSHLLLGFGGHSGAAGLSIHREKVGELRQEFCRVVDEMISAEDLVPQLVIDAEATLEDITEQLVNEYAALEPFGYGNPKPVLAIRGLQLQEVRKVGHSNDHLKLTVAQGNTICDAIGFSLGAWADILDWYCGPVDLAFTPEINQWRGQKNIQLQLKDVRIPEEEISPVDRLFIDETAATTDPYASIGAAQEFYTKIVGVTFEDRQEVVSSLRSGQKLKLVREVDNPHDPNAIAVTTLDGKQVGYLRRGIAKHLAPLLDGETGYEATVSQVTGGGEGKSLGVNVFVRKEEDPEEYLRWLAGKDTRRRLTGLPDEELKTAISRAIIGEHSYHPKQAEALEALQRGANTLLIMGTGRGKSAVFQSMAAYKALRHRQATVIIYPLRALVNDQLRSMQAKLAPLGIRVLKATGSLTTREREELNTALHLGEADVLLATPEFVQRNLAQHPGLLSRLGLFVVDESHHIGRLNSQRSAYRSLDRLREQLGNPLTLAVTATADDQVAEAIIQALSIDTVIVDPHIRANLSVVDQRGLTEGAKFAYLLDLVKEGEKAIIYVNSREGATNLSRDLRRALRHLKDRIAFYHGGLTNSQRVMVEEMFAVGSLRTVVSTSAFGEGVDIPDIRHVLHYHLTFNFTDFNQQSGRAGRDGKPAAIHLLYNQEDVEINRFILRSKAPDRDVLAALYRALIRNADQEGRVSLTNAELAEVMQGLLKGAGEFFRPSPETVSAALGVLYELGLIDREKTGSSRVIYLAPRPEGKLDLNDSVRYNEGIVEKEVFEEFQKWALCASKEEILSLINKPIYPVHLER
ncbi:MAG: single-stranded-DNA-specific exonuclease RecJ [Firmicutes bacterium]|nr:single-stranded-DNA-specific exonuclease RecJ [Bacillota bacterium]